jgi:DDE superfamily endonuclease
MAPVATVQRAQLLLLAYRHPQWQKATSAQPVGCPGNTVKQWRQRWQRPEAWDEAPRAGTRRTCTPLPRTPVVVVACSAPRQYGQAWPRWSGEKVAQVAVEQHLVATLAPSTLRRWWRADKIKPWRYHSWQPSTDPQFVEKAGPGLDLYAQAPALQAQGELSVCADEKTSMQARQRGTPTKAAAPGEVVQVADRDKRMGALPLFCALAVASGLTFTQTRMTKKFVDFKAFLQAFFQSTLWAGSTALHLILDHGPTHAPKQLGTWWASLALPCEVRR